MLSFEKLKEFFILFFSFGIIYLFQYVDDKKRCKKRDGIYDNIKVPLLATSIIGLILFWNKDSLISCPPPVIIPGNVHGNEPGNAPGNAPGNINPNVPANSLTPEFLMANLQGGNLDVYTDFPEW